MNNDVNVIEAIKKAFQGRQNQTEAGSDPSETTSVKDGQAHSPKWAKTCFPLLVTSLLGFAVLLVLAYLYLSSVPFRPTNTGASDGAKWEREVFNLNLYGVSEGDTLFLVPANYDGRWTLNWDSVVLKGLVGVKDGAIFLREVKRPTVNLSTPSVVPLLKTSGDSILWGIVFPADQNPRFTLPFEIDKDTVIIRFRFIMNNEMRSKPLFGNREEGVVVASIDSGSCGFVLEKMPGPGYGPERFSEIEIWTDQLTPKTTGQFRPKGQHR